MPEELHYWQLPHGNSIFCDDIRNEVGGKTSFMGVYNGALFPAAPFPNAIRLAFFVTYREPVAYESDKIKLVITFAPDDGELIELLEAELDVKTARERALLLPGSGDDSINIELSIGGTFQQL